MSSRYTLPGRGLKIPTFSTFRLTFVYTATGSRAGVAVAMAVAPGRAFILGFYATVHFEKYLAEAQVLSLVWFRNNYVR